MTEIVHSAFIYKKINFRKHHWAELSFMKSQIPDVRAVRLSVLLMLSVMLGYCFVSVVGQHEYANSTSRLAFVAAYVDHGTTDINPFHHLTSDKAEIDGNYYMDKAPGMSFMAIPIYASIKMLGGWMGEWVQLFTSTGGFSGDFTYIAHILAVSTSGLLTVLAALAMVIVAEHLSGRLSAAVAVAVICVLATPVWGWAVMFLGHGVAAACLFLGFSAIYILTSVALSAASRVVLAGLAGLFLSWAVVVEFTAAPASALIAVYGLYKLRPLSWRLSGLLIGLAVLAGSISALPLFAYNTVNFGGPLSLGYQHVVGFEGMDQGFFGLTLPKPEVLVHILVGPYRGLLIFAPILVFAPRGLVAMWRTQVFRPEVILFILIAVYYLLLNSSYHYWDGGWSTGPRHLTPMIPFVVLPMVFVWRDAEGHLKTVFKVVLGLSIAISFVSVSTTMLAPNQYYFPLIDPILRDFLSGNIRASLYVFSDYLALDLPGFLAVGLNALVISTLAALMVVRLRGR
jgi:hypothetical protein